jgi:hypothetical protein
MTYNPECISGVSWITICNKDDGEERERKEEKIKDNTEGTGAYDDLPLLPKTLNFDNGGCSLDVNTIPSTCYSKSIV